MLAQDTGGYDRPCGFCNGEGVIAMIDYGYGEEMYWEDGPEPSCSYCGDQAWIGRRACPKCNRRGQNQRHRRPTRRHELRWRLRAVWYRLRHGEEEPF